MRFPRLITVFVFGALFFTGLDAHAEAFHERVKVTPIKQSGKVVGARVKLTLRPDRNAKKVRIGLAPAGALDPLTNRDKFSDASKGHLLHQFSEVTGIQNGKPMEKTFDLRYGKGNKLKGGEKIDVISAWDVGYYWHIWGSSKLGGQAVTLPKGD